MVEERMTELPADVILSQIVPRLPARSVVRFRSVCKRWNSFLKTHMFYELHHQRLVTASIDDDHPKKLLLVSSKTKPFVKFLSIDCEAPDDHGFLSLTPPFKVAGRVSILTSCNGMICLGTMKKKKRWYEMEFLDLILWNPFISEYKTLSSTTNSIVPTEEECYEFTIYDDFAMYYFSSEDDYRILRVSNRSRNAYIYSLKSDSWRKLVITPAVAWCSYNLMPSVVLDEKVFFLNYDEEHIWVIRFDTKTEKFTKMETQFSKKWSDDLGIQVDRGCFHLHVNHFNRGWMEVEVLKMNGDGDWTAMGTYSGEYGLALFRYQPLHLMRNGNWLMRNKGYLYNVDMNGVYKNGTHKFERLNGKEKMCIPAEGKYIETFVSPNRYMRAN